MTALRVALLIDGGHLRVQTQKAGYTYNPDMIERISRACIAPDEEAFRVLYYDCAPYVGEARLPISGGMQAFTGSDVWLKHLAARDLFAVRLGVLKFRGWRPKKTPPVTGVLTDADFVPNFEQKGVDMRIGLDVATFAATRSVDRLVIITADTDCVPAFKHARIAGLQTVLITFPKIRAVPELTWHSDFVREIAWPTP